ncbi:MAG: LCP family protein [Anaerolineae bacterium]|nr:LCP family protein [Anaerolineae bacterium]
MKRTTKRHNRHAEQQSLDRLTRGLYRVAAILGVVILVLGTTIVIDQWAEIMALGESLSSSPTTQPGPTAVTAQALPNPAPSPVPITPPPCQPPQDWVTYQVQEGNTLYSLAKDHGTDVEVLQRVNCLDDDVILVGQELYVPPPAGTEARATEPSLPPEDAGPIPWDRYTNIILLGTDKKADRVGWRTDTMIVVSVDAEQNLVYLLSIPRDLWVEIPGHGPDRINTADFWGEAASPGGGPELVRRTLQENLGIPVDYFVRIDFQGFVSVVDAIGGVEIDVDCALPDIGLESGIHMMDGKQALRYARSRMDTSDFDRSRRQREILMALWEKGKSMDVIPKLPALWRAMASSFETDLSLGQVLSLAYNGIQLSPDRILTEAIGPGQVYDWVTPLGAEVLLPRDGEIEALLKDFYSSPDTSSEDAARPAKVQVLNGSWLSEAEQLASHDLRRAGFRIAGTGLADSQDYPQTQILFYGVDASIAQRVVKTLKLPSSVLRYQHDPSSAVDFRIVLGADYDPCAAP